VAQVFVLAALRRRSAVAQKQLMHTVHTHAYILTHIHAYTHTRLCCFSHTRLCCFSHAHTYPRTTFTPLRVLAALPGRPAAPERTAAATRAAAAAAIHAGWSGRCRGDGGGQASGCVDRCPCSCFVCARVCWWVWSSLWSNQPGAALLVHE